MTAGLDLAAFAWDGPAHWRAPVTAALERVVDPELALTIVDAGLVRGVTMAGDDLHVQLTMTSAACPVTDLIVDDVRGELARVLPGSLAVHVELLWEPPWTPDRMSERARRVMGW